MSAQSETERRLALARRNAQIYLAQPGVAAIVLVGSTARGQCDAYSDIDMTVIYGAMPSQEQRAATREALGASDWKALPGEPSDDDYGEAFTLHGVECQVGHTTLAKLEEVLDNVLERYHTDHDSHTILGGLREGLALHGAPLLERWQARIAAYPDGLARAMVRDHLRFRPTWYLRERFAGRDTLLMFQTALVDNLRRVLGVLLGLNRLFPEHDFKRLGGLLARMAVAPPDLDARLRATLYGGYAEAPRLLGALVEDVFALVAQHMPELEIAEALATFQQPDPGV